MKYFAYGSNCNPKILEKKGVDFTSRQPAVLRGYQLLFNKQALRENLPPGIGFANINEADSESTVEGILYEIVDEHVGRLDESERYPDHYTRVDVTVQADGAEVRCTAYQAQPDKIASGLKPSRNYLNHILAARDFLSWQYFNALDKSQTFSATCGCCARVSEIVFVREDQHLHMLCQPCREARTVWGDVRGRKLTIAEAQAVMQELVQDGEGFSSVNQLIEAAVAGKIIAP